MDGDLYNFVDKNLYKISGETSLSASSNTPVVDSAEVDTSDSSGGETVVEDGGNLTGEMTLESGMLKSANFVSNVSGWRLTPTSGELNFAVSVDSLDIPDTISAGSFHVDSSGNTWWGSTVIGTAVAKILNTGAATFTSFSLNSGAGGLVLNSTTPSIALGAATDYFIGIGFWVGLNSAKYKLHIGDPANDFLKWDGTNLTITGTIIATTATIASTTSDTFTINSDSTDANVDLIFGRTTGGNATIRWNGTNLSCAQTFLVLNAATVAATTITNTTLTTSGYFDLTGPSMGQVRFTNKGAGAGATNYLNIDLGESWRYGATLSVGGSGGTLLRFSNPMVADNSYLVMGDQSSTGIGFVNPAGDYNGTLTIRTLVAGTAECTGIVRIVNAAAIPTQGTDASLNDPHFRVYGGTNSTTDYIELYHDQTNAHIKTGEGSLYLEPVGDIILDPTGNDILPVTNYDLNLGALGTKFLTLHAAELWVETLVAQNTMATIGGRILVGPTTSLVRDLAAAGTTIYVKHNEMASGDRVYIEANSKVEFMAITSAAFAETDGYSYTVTRNLDGTGANDWYAGDAMFNTGTTGDGFIDIYSLRGVKAATEYGPTIVGNVRNSATYNDWTSHWAIGNLNGLYGYGVTTYGVAFGEYAASKTHITIDSTNGYRIFNGTATVLGQWDASGNILLGNAATENTYITSTSVQMRDGSTVYTDLTAGVLTLGLVSGGEYMTLDGTNGIKLYGNAVESISLSNAGLITIGEVGASKSNIQISSNAVKLRTNTTDKIVLGTNGNITLTGNLAMSTAGAFYAGQTAYNTGTGYWLEYNGGTPRISIGNGTTTNNLTWDGTTLMVNGSAITSTPLYGDGSDGDVTISGDTTLTADMYYNNLTVNNGVSLNMGGYRIFVKGTTTNNGTIHRNGVAGGDGGNGNNGAVGYGSATGGTAGTAGTALADGYLSGSQAGKAGQVGGAGGVSGGHGGNGVNGTAGSNQTVCLGVAGTTGGNGGAGGRGFSSEAEPGGTASTGASGGTATASNTKPRNVVLSAIMLEFNNPASITKYQGSAGSGSGGSGGGGGGGNSCGGGAGGGSGGSGSAGGVGFIASRIIVNTGTISCNGGNGGKGGNGGNFNYPADGNAGGGGGAGGGAGGSGGYLTLIYNNLNNSGTISVAGGNGGALGTGGTGYNDTGTFNGTAGANGTTGVLIQLPN